MIGTLIKNKVGNLAYFLRRSWELDWNWDIDKGLSQDRDYSKVLSWGELVRGLRR